MQQSYEYSLKLDNEYQFPVPAAGFELRNSTADDIDDLGALMLNSYRGTIDYEGETLAEARMEMKESLAGKYGPSLPECSWLLYKEAELTAACLAIRWEGESCAFITFVMTGSDWKGKGLAAVVLQATLASLARSGFQEVRAVITLGNEPSERLFASAGFSQVEDQPAREEPS